MPLFNVTVTQDVTRSTQVTIEAEDADQANQGALESVMNKQNSAEPVGWSYDECDGGGPYLPDPDSTEEVGQ